MAKGAKPMWDRFPVFYHRRLPPHRLAKRILAAVGALLAVVWIAAALVRRDEQPFSSGAMSVGHAMLVDNCRACHTPDTAFRRFQHWSDADMAHAMNRACLDCHGNVVGFDPRTLSAWHQVGPHEVSVGAGGAVSGPQEPAVACSACHTEHRGFVRLTQLDDRQCTSCHADLDRARPGQPYYPHIAAFDPTRTSADRAHPEFRFKQENWVDRAAIRFNHAIHLRTDPLGATTPTRHAAFRITSMAGTS